MDVADDLDGLVEQVLTAYKEFPPEKINKGFQTLQTVIELIIQHQGENDYKLPHYNKDKDGDSSKNITLVVDQHTTDWAREFLHPEEDSDDESSEEEERLGSTEEETSSSSEEEEDNEDNLEQERALDRWNCLRSRRDNAEE